MVRDGFALKELWIPHGYVPPHLGPEEATIDNAGLEPQSAVAEPIEVIEPIESPTAPWHRVMWPLGRAYVDEALSGTLDVAAVVSEVSRGPPAKMLCIHGDHPLNYNLEILIS